MTEQQEQPEATPQLDAGTQFVAFVLAKSSEIVGARAAGWHTTDDNGIGFNAGCGKIHVSKSFIADLNDLFAGKYQQALEGDAEQERLRRIRNIKRGIFGLVAGAVESYPGRHAARVVNGEANTGDALVNGLVDGERLFATAIRRGVSGLATYELFNRISNAADFESHAPGFKEINVMPVAGQVESEVIAKLIQAVLERGGGDQGVANHSERGMEMLWEMVTDGMGTGAFVDDLLMPAARTRFHDEIAASNAVLHLFPFLVEPLERSTGLTQRDLKATEPAEFSTVQARGSLAGLLSGEMIRMMDQMLEGKQVTPLAIMDLSRKRRDNGVAL